MNNGQERDRVRFAPNIQQQLALADTDGLLISNGYADKVVYLLTDGRELAVQPQVAASINMLGLDVGEPFVLVKRWDGRRGHTIRWDVWRAVEAERVRAKNEAPDLETQLAASIEEANRRNAPASPPDQKVRPINVVPDQLKLPFAESLLAQSKLLTDTYASVLRGSSSRAVGFLPRPGNGAAERRNSGDTPGSKLKKRP